jgi:D-alanyl-D-alanine carboxypeptidase
VSSSVSSREQRLVAAREALESNSHLLDGAMKYYPVPGGVITFADREGVLTEQPFGYCDRERKIAMTNEKLFEIGSISKFFTALVVLELVNDGTLRLDRTLKELLPWLEFEFDATTVTLRELLNHTAGFALGSDALPDDAAEVFNSRSFAPRRGENSFRYSNVGYLLLGEIVRTATGQRCSKIVNDRWLPGLGMTSALGEVRHIDRPLLAKGYWTANPDRPWVPSDPLEPAVWFELESSTGNVVASGEDMAALISAIINASSGEERGGPLTTDLFSQAIGDLAPSGEPIYLLEGMAAVESSRYGYGINVELIDGHTCVSHGGGMVGYSTFMLVDCNLQVGVSVLTNANGNSLASHLLARALLAQLRTALQKQEPQSLTFDTQVRELPDRALGDFADFEGDVITFTQTSNYCAVHYQGRTGDIFQLQNGRYVTNHPDLRRFHLDFVEGQSTQWHHGPRVFGEGSAPSPADPLCGHYRSYSPWYPEFRIYSRQGKLFLAPGDGIEASHGESQLVLIGPSEFRIGESEESPERLRLGAERLGEVIAVNRDGCWYSRVSSE